MPLSTTINRMKRGSCLCRRASSSGGSVALGVLRFKLERDYDTVPPQMLSLSQIGCITQPRRALSTILSLQQILTSMERSI